MNTTTVSAGRVRLIDGLGEVFSGNGMNDAVQLRHDGTRALLGRRLRKADRDNGTANRNVASNTRRARAIPGL